MEPDGTHTFAILSTELARALLRLRTPLSSDGEFQSLMRNLGWEVNEIPAPLQVVVTRVDELGQALEMISETASLDVTALAKLVDSIRKLVMSVVELQNAVFDPALSVDNINQHLPRQLIDTVLIEYLEDRHPVMAFALQSLGLIRVRRVPAQGNRPAYIHEEIAWEEFLSLITNPGGVFRRAYSWGDSHFDGHLFLQVVQDLLLALGLPAFLRGISDAESQILEEGVELERTPSRLQLDMSIFDRQVGNTPVMAGIRLLPLPIVGPRVPGLAILPYATADFEQRFPLTSVAHLSITSSLDLQSGIGLILRPDEPIRVIVGLDDPENAVQTQGTITARLDFEDPTLEPTVLIGTASGSRFEVTSASIIAKLLLDGECLELFSEAELLGAELVIASGEGDSFLNRILPSGGLATHVDLALGFSTERGIYFRGSNALEVNIPTHFEILGIEVNAVTVALRPTADDLPINLGASVKLELGPLLVTVENFGLAAVFTFPGSGGNLGPIDFELKFKPPDGIGLSIDGGGFKGGGPLDFEPEQQRYSGTLELEYQDKFTLQAIGLLTTRLPNGQSGFSLLIVISSEFTPIQLGFGFKLNGVGGLLGLNRAVKIERLRTGLRDKTLNSILFPANLVANADRIISDLRQVFPPQEGRFVFGPMAKITWGTRALLTADLGLIIEVPAPVRLTILGVVRGVLPDEKAAILRLQVNFLGVIDFERQQLSFDASLFDSKLLSYPLTGDMAIRLYWGGEPNFLLTVGGFHPVYQPPPLNLPPIRRLTLALLSGDNPRLTLETYFAVTSNTVQFGARVELYAAAWKFNAYGFLSFDVLFQFNPFFFVADITAMLALRVGSSSIASIKLSLTLEGPTPWRAKGSASLRLCWFIKVKIRFNKPFGEARDTRLLDIDVLSLLVEALKANDNWEGELPGGRHRLASLKDVEALNPNQLFVHPVGTLRISQKVVPLNLRIDKLGSQRPSKEREFSITEVQLGEDTPISNPVPVQESFAPAQFFDMEDQEKLASPSFKSFDSGVRIGAPDALHTAYAAAREVAYELKYIDSQRDQRLVWADGLFSLDADAFNTWAVQGTIAKSDLSFARNRKSSLAPEAVAVVQEPFAIVNTSDLQLFDESSLMSSEHEALTKIDELIDTNPALQGVLQAVPAFEIGL
jgi:hypothetical protein